jgi:hypothetical protein
MIIQKTVNINGTDFIKTYSDQHKMIERDGVQYTEAFDPVDSNRIYIETEIEAPLSGLEVSKEEKRDLLKKTRDEKEMEPIEYNGHYFDFDQKSYDRITAAIFALSKTEGASIMWTTADNQSVAMTAEDLENVISAAAVRSNILHVTYRTLAERLDNAMLEEEVNAIAWPAE